MKLSTNLYSGMIQSACFGGAVVLAVMHLGGSATVYQNDQAGAQADDELAATVERLESRVVQLERVVFANSKLNHSRAMRQFESAKNSLEHSRILFAKGFITDIQLQQDQNALERAKQELKFASSNKNQQMLVGELEVLSSKQKLLEARNVLEQTRNLARRGYVSQTQVEREAARVDLLEREMESARIKLDAATKLEALKEK